MSKFLLGLLAASMYFGSIELAVAQKAAPLAPPKRHTPNSAPPNHGIVRLPIGTLNIDIDDEEKPFKLKNLNRRFSGTQLTEFLAGYISQTDGVISIVVHSSTKRNAEGEREVVELLTQLAEQGKVLVVYLPPPTGFDPDSALRKYAESFPTDQPENIKPSLRIYIPDHAMQNPGRFRIGIQEVNIQDFETTLRNQLATNRYGRLIVETGKAGEPSFEQLAAQIAAENEIAVEMAPPPTSYLLPIE